MTASSALLYASPVCGVWPTQRRLVAVVVKGGVAGQPLVVPRTDDGRWSLLQQLSAEPGLELTLPAHLLRGDPLAAFGMRAGVVLWAVPASLVEALQLAAGAALASPRAAAAMLARLPGIPALRPQLRRLTGTGDPRQLRLV